VTALNTRENFAPNGIRHDRKADRFRHTD
jgi:hypothetical protein